MSGIKGWEKAVLIKHPDNLCASTFTQKAFIPSYEKSYCKPDMTLMVTMEYRRLWFDERAVWQVDAYPKRKKDSASTTYEQRWREKQKEKVKGKDADLKPKRKKLKKYQNCRSKTDSGRGYVGCLSKGDSPCQAKATPKLEKLSAENSPAQGSLTSQKEAKLPMGSFTSPRPENQSKVNSPAQGSLTSKDLPDQATGFPPQPQGHELVPKCPRCGTFHAQRSRCPAIVLCKDKPFKDRIMSDTC